MAARTNGVYPKPNDELLACMQEHSFKDFHVKGFDYVCLKRTPELTRKVYFFNGDVSQLPEVVNPHNHRYNFTTTVLRGHMSNSQYIESPQGEVYNEFSYMTPLNGGDGFTWKKETRLFEVNRMFYAGGYSNTDYTMLAHEFHTIRMHADDTVLVLDQYPDIKPLWEPTRTFIGKKEAPNLNGLYSKFQTWQLLDYYHQIRYLEERWNDAWRAGQRSRRLSLFSD